jgi:hypothetical protein
MELCHTNRDSLKALRNKVDLILETTLDPFQNRTGRSRELLRSALALTDDLMSESRKSAKSRRRIGAQGRQVHRCIAARVRLSPGSRGEEKDKIRQ